MKIKDIEVILAHWAENFQGCKSPKILRKQAGWADSQATQVASLVLNGERQTINLPVEADEALPLSEVKLKGITFGDWCAYTEASEVAESILHDILDGVVDGITLQLEQQTINRMMVFSKVEKAMARAYGSIKHSHLSGGKYASVKSELLGMLTIWQRGSNLRKITNAVWRLVKEWHIECA